MPFIKHTSRFRPVVTLHVPPHSADEHWQRFVNNERHFDRGGQVWQMMCDKRHNILQPPLTFSARFSNSKEMIRDGQQCRWNSLEHGVFNWHLHLPTPTPQATHVLTSLTHPATHPATHPIPLQHPSNSVGYSTTAVALSILYLLDIAIFFPDMHDFRNFRLSLWTVCSLITDWIYYNKSCPV